MNAGEVRRAVWHLRNNGWEGLREKNRRQRAEKGIYRGSASGAQGFTIGRGTRRRLSFNAAQAYDGAPSRRLRAAVILDDFSHLAFGFEWDQQSITRAEWRNELLEARPDLLFVESAWAGNGGQWKYQLTGPNGPKDALRELVAFCKAEGIPTVFWNKEDPPHYLDFLEAARLFDYVFTSDSSKIPAYQADLGHDRVSVLQFAAQPAIHNPIRPRTGWHQRDIAFAGMFFAHKYPERRAQMELLLGGALDAATGMETGLEIFSRHSEVDPNYRFPAPYNTHVVGSLSYPQMLTAYKAYKAFLNVNSVIDSPSMCARRIFEITASGTSVISTPSLALDKMWQEGEQLVVNDREEAAHMITAISRNPEMSARQLHLAQRKIWAEHTYSHRVEKILAAALPASAREISLPSVSLLVSSMRPQQLEQVFATVGRLQGVEVELVLLTHGFTANADDIRRWQEQYGVSRLTLLERQKSTSLGECLNACVTAASGEVLSKMDDDDFYAPNYLLDLLNALSYSGAEIVGKQAHYMHLSKHKANLLRFKEREHRFTNLVMGPTITAERAVFESFPFRAVGRGEDSTFLREITSAGGRIYSSDKYNYSQFRGNVDHAWSVPEIELLTSGDVVFFGDPAQHLTI